MTWLMMQPTRTARIVWDTCLFHLILALTLTSTLGARPLPMGQDPPGRSALRIAVIGESNLRTNFIESLKDAAREEKLTIDIVPRGDPSLIYTVIIAQETTVGSAAAAVIALDRQGDVAGSVVRSGRLSGRGALNASAKELVKKFLVLAR